MTTTSTDRIEKSILLRTPRGSRLARPADAKGIRRLVGVVLDGAFVPGPGPREDHAQGIRARSLGRSRSKKMEPEDALLVPLAPLRHRAGRHSPRSPFGRSSEFRLEEVADGTRLTVVESGFDRIPLERRAKAFG